MISLENIACHYIEKFQMFILLLQLQYFKGYKLKISPIKCIYMKNRLVWMIKKMYVELKLAPFMNHGQDDICYE